MLRDITIGQYYPAESCIHRLDPRTKIVGTMLYIISLFLFKSFPGFIVVVTAYTGILILSHVPFSYVIRGLKPILLILFITVFFNILATKGTVLWQWKAITITKEGLQRGAFMGFRLILLILGTSMMTYTTTPIYAKVEVTADSSNALDTQVSYSTSKDGTYATTDAAKTITNTYVTGKLDVTKSVTLDGAAVTADSSAMMTINTTPMA